MATALEDRETIGQLIASYCHFMDNHECQA